MPVLRRYISVHMEEILTKYSNLLLLVSSPENITIFEKDLISRLKRFDKWELWAKQQMIQMMNTFGLYLEDIKARVASFQGYTAGEQRRVLDSLIERMLINGSSLKEATAMHSFMCGLFVRDVYTLHNKIPRFTIALNSLANKCRVFFNEHFRSVYSITPEDTLAAYRHKTDMREISPTKPLDALKPKPSATKHFNTAERLDTPRLRPAHANTEHLCRAPRPSLVHERLFSARIGNFKGSQRPSQSRSVNDKDEIIYCRDTWRRTTMLTLEELQKKIETDMQAHAERRAASAKSREEAERVALEQARIKSALFDSQSARITALRLALADKENKLKSVTAELESSRADAAAKAATFKDQREELEGQKTSIEASLRRLTIEKETVSDNLSAIQKEKAAIERDLQTLKSERVAEVETLRVKVAEVETLREKVAEVETLRKTEAELTTLDKTNATARIADLEKEHRKSVQLLGILMARNKELEGYEIEQTAELSEVRGKLIQVTEEYNSLAKSIKRELDNGDDLPGADEPDMSTRSKSTLHFVHNRRPSVGGSAAAAAAPAIGLRLPKNGAHR